ncbi:hypothetical protein BBK82_25850 [Lentzea guizhouensis]|uniref:Uncharacterized protein n=1 Tax=Lentzea guizhouensis TaxID=1586287 RepID=A0A1B2HMN9_9PSEU|nr:hypothetical protein [Lentzea guizhouensis]ANZ38984.1 hypothetical protein BBK82_25850 [Lentzea guizhouensis]
MRIVVALLGMLVLFGAAVFVMFFGILGFTPTTTCSGTCQVPLVLSFVAPVVFGLAATFATWFRALQRPRAYWPWLGAALILGTYLVSLSVADRVL